MGRDRKESAISGLQIFVVATMNFSKIFTQILHHGLSGVRKCEYRILHHRQDNY